MEIAHGVCYLPAKAGPDPPGETPFAHGTVDHIFQKTFVRNIFTKMAKTHQPLI